MTYEVEILLADEVGTKEFHDGVTDITVQEGALLVSGYGWGYTYAPGFWLALAHTKEERYGND